MIKVICNASQIIGLEEYGLIKPVLDGYRAFHTQGYEYMAEILTDKLRKAQGVSAQ